MILFPFRYLWWLISRVRRSIGKPPEYILFVLENDLPALPDPPRPIWQRFTVRPRLSVKELGEQFDLITNDPRVKGVVLHLRPVGMPMATLQDLRELVGRIRQSGRRVVAWAPYYTTGTYYLACACDEILLMPAGAVQPLGLATTGMFLRDGLARFGIEADFVQVSPYKSAPDMWSKSHMSPELREQVTSLLDSQQKELLSAIGKGRVLDEKGAQSLVDASPYTDETALEMHAVDAVLPEEQLAERVGQGSGIPIRIGTWEQAQKKVRTHAPTLRARKYVAVLRIEGTIIDGRSAKLPFKPPIEIPLVGGDRAGDLTVVRAARQVAGDKRAAAVVLYVNSRGGSATASEAMRQALDVIAARKPLVVVMGPFAASGGYWVSTPGRWIIARPGTITGSIGVFTGKFVTAGMWSKLMFNRETIAFGQHVTMESDERPFTDEEREIVRGQIARIYKLFLERVGKARNMTPDEVHPIADGRVWTGRQAFERKLVDELGGFDAAVRKARTMAGLSDTAPVREARAPKRSIPPVSVASAQGFVAYLLEGISLLSRAPALAVMDYLPGDLT
ncbi:MAG: signal peptide peptidase SppA [Candidatus Dormibacteraceae bacterium]